MDELKVIWTATALKQRNYIFDYWNKRNRNNKYSRKLNLLIRDRIELIKTFPEIGTQTEYKNTRAVSIGHYNILYKLDSTQLIINGFWDNRQNPKKLSSFLEY